MAIMIITHDTHLWPAAYVTLTLTHTHTCSHVLSTGKWEKSQHTHTHTHTHKCVYPIISCHQVIFYFLTNPQIPSGNIYWKMATAIHIPMTPSRQWNIGEIWGAHSHAMKSGGYESGMLRVRWNEAAGTQTRCRWTDIKTWKRASTLGTSSVAHFLLHIPEISSQTDGVAI